MCGSCPAGCDASDGVTECYLGCRFANGQKLDSIYVADVPPGLLQRDGRPAPASGPQRSTNRSFWGLHTMTAHSTSFAAPSSSSPREEPYDRWHTILPRARYPNRVASAGSIEGANLSLSLTLTLTLTLNLTLTRRMGEAGSQSHVGVETVGGIRPPARVQRHSRGPEDDHRVPRLLRLRRGRPVRRGELLNPNPDPDAIPNPRHHPIAPTLTLTLTLNLALTLTLTLTLIEGGSRV